MLARKGANIFKRAKWHVKWLLLSMLIFLFLLESSLFSTEHTTSLTQDRDFHSRSYSSHICYDGVNETELEMDGHADDPRWRTCLFRNVCFSFTSQKFIYFSQSPSEIFEYPESTTSGFPSYFTNLERTSDTGGGPFSDDNPFGKSARPIPFSLHAIRNAIPSHFPFAEASAHYLISPFSTENFGHVLLDLILPAYQSANYFRLVPEEVQLMVGKALDGCPPAAQELISILFNHAEIPFTFGLSKGHRMYFDAQPSKVFPLAVGAPSHGQHLCFRKLVAGSGRTGLAFGAGPLWTHFIDHIVSRSGADIVAKFNTKVDSLNVLLLFKSADERRASQNPAALLEFIQKHLRVPVRIVYGHELSKLSFREQLNLIMDVAVLVTDAGGMSSLTAFMRPNTACIIVSYFLSPTNSSSRMENLFWRHETRRKVYHFPVRKDEVTLQHPKHLPDFRDYMERQWNTGDFWRYRNFGRARIDLVRMLTYVEAALAHVCTTNSLPPPERRTAH
jgi:hypothetical protein